MNNQEIWIIDAQIFEVRLRYLGSLKYCIEHWNTSYFEKHRVVQFLYAAYYIWFDETKSIL